MAALHSGPGLAAATVLVLLGLSAAPALAQGGGVPHANLFALAACLGEDATFCPQGQFDQAAFDALYDDPESNAAHYPAGGTGSFQRRIVPLCENGTAQGGSCGVETLRCTDGTRPLYYYAEGSGADRNRWIINIQGGGATCNGPTCAFQYLREERHDFSSAYGRNSARSARRGVLSDAPDNRFRNFNRVDLDKCVGDRNLGDATVADTPFGSDATGTVYYHGLRIVKAVLQSLKDQAGSAPDLRAAEQIVFMTQSNGSNGGYLYIDRLQDYALSEIAAPGHAPDVRYIASSYLRPNPETEYRMLPSASLPARYADIRGHVDPASAAATVCGKGFDPAAPSYQDWMDEGRQIGGPSRCAFGTGGDHARGIGGMYFSTRDYRSGKEAEQLRAWGASDATPTIDASCLAAHAATGDVEACHDSRHVATYHMTTPTFFAAQTGDRNLRTTRVENWTGTFEPEHCDSGEAQCHPENYRGDTDADGNPVPAEAAYQKEDFRRRVLRLAEDVFLAPSAHKESVGGPGHGGFVDNTVDHMALADFSKLRRTMKADAGARPRELQEYLQAWLEPAPGRPVVCVDEGELYDVEVPPPAFLADAPANLRCTSGFYALQGATIDPGQTCNDPFANTASPRFSCPRLADPVDANAVFDWAEWKFPALFPAGAGSVGVDHLGVHYTVRAYATGNHLGITDDGGIFGLGPLTGDVLTNFGSIADYEAQIRSDACSVYPDSCGAARAGGPRPQGPAGKRPGRPAGRPGSAGGAAPGAR